MPAPAMAPLAEEAIMPHTVAAAEQPVLS
jgi:hypothetical protein